MKPDKEGWYWWKGSDSDPWIPVQCFIGGTLEPSLRCAWDGDGSGTISVEVMWGEFGGYIPYPNS